MNYQLLEECVEVVKSFEDFRADAYPDPGSRNGFPWTLGYGHTKGVKKGDVVTIEEAEMLLRDDLTEAAMAVERHVKVPLTDFQYGALVSFVFNVGGTAFRDSTLLKRLNSDRFDDVPAQLNRWVYNDGKIMKGLQRRRAAEIAHFLKAEEPTAMPASEPSALQNLRCSLF